MIPREPLRLTAAEFVTWAGGYVSEPIRADVRITVDHRHPGEGFDTVLKRIAQELRAGASKVLLLSRRDQAACVYSNDTLPALFQIGDSLVIPDALPGFTAPVATFFE